MRFLRGTQAEADVGAAVIIGLLLLCLVGLLVYATSGLPLGGL